MKKMFLLFAVVALFAAVPSFAQSKVCVHNHAWYALKMKVNGSKGSTGWSEVFPAAQWRCQDLDSAAGDGQTFTVDVSPYAGDAITCEGGVKTRMSNYTGSITYIAWGATGNPGCKSPGD